MTSPDPSDLAARLALVEDRAAIADLVHDYALCMRTGDCERGAAMFVEDGLFETRRTTPGAPKEIIQTTTMRGRAEILEHLQASVGRMAVWPVLHNLLIAVDGDEARASSVMIANILATGQRLIGEYEDHFVRRGARWLIAVRRFTTVA